MNITESEGFLLVWALVATVAWGLQAQKAYNLGEAVKAMMFALKEIAQGKAEVSMRDDDTMQIKKLKE